MPDPDNLYLRLLVIRCQAQDLIALEELIAIHQPRLRSFLHKMHPSHADDLLQDVWIDVFHDLPQLVDPASFVPWLYRIARNRVYRRLRRRDVLSLDDQDLPAEVSADEDTFTAEDAAAVHAALDLLAPEQREVLLLRFMEDMPKHDWQKRFEEDLIEVLTRTHHTPPTLATASLKLTNLATQETTTQDVPMTKENRRALWTARKHEANHEKHRMIQ